MNPRTTPIWILISWLALSSAALGSPQAPVAVSPGGEAVVSTPSACPTFSWGLYPGAASYEIAVYRVRDSGDEVEPVLTREIPAAALGWTPSSEDCLEPGRRYGWSVRAVTEEGTSEWASPLFFAPEQLSMPDDLAAALEIVRRHLPSLQHPQAIEASHSRELAAGTSDPESPEVAVAAAVGSPEAKLTVKGEVRTLSPQGEPRLWGKGRQGTRVYPKEGSTSHCANVFKGVQYGLSRIAVDWGSAADACPVGTWVCDQHEVGSCDTSRSDTSLDGLSCIGGSHNFDADDHRGWTAEEIGPVHAVVNTEKGVKDPFFTCETLPVWCCWPGGLIGASAAAPDSPE